MPKHVLIVDPQPFFCDALRGTLEADSRIRVVGCTTDELEAERLAGAGANVVLAELTLNSGSGLSLARRLRDVAPVVILTRENEGDVLLDAVAAGAAGCIGHAVGAARLTDLVAGPGNGFLLDHERLHDTLRRASVARSQTVARLPELERLTPREREVLALLARGLDNEGIGGQLYLSAHTVRTHVGSILRKLGVHSRADAARVALRAGEGEAAMHVLRIRGPNLGAG